MIHKMVELGTLIKQAKTVRCGDGEYPVLSMTMHDGLIFQDDKFKKVIASKDRSDYKVVFRNQLVISFPIDEGVLAAQRITDAGIVSPAYGIWDIDQKQILPEFLEYALRCDRSISYYKAKLRGSTARRRSLPTPTLLTHTIPLPDINEQKYILEVIHKVKNIINNRKMELLRLDSLIKARFVEMFGNPVSNPKGWEKKRLVEVCTKLNDGTHFSPESFETGDYKYITAKNIKSGGFDFSNITYVPESVHRPIYERCNPEKGDVLYIKDGVTTGIAMVNTLDEEFTLLSSVALLKQNREFMNGLFLCGVLNNDEMYSYIRRNMGGAAITRLTIAKLNEIIVIVPPLEIQKQYAAFVTQVDKSKAQVQKTLDETQLLFDSLMQEYFG